MSSNASPRGRRRWPHRPLPAVAGTLGVGLLSVGLLGVGVLGVGPAVAVPVASGHAAVPVTAAPSADHRPLPGVVTGTGDRLYPEGVAWDPTRRAFLVGSVRTGVVSVVGRDGVARPLVADRSVVSTFGLTVDAARHRLLVTFADIGAGERSRPETVKRQSGLLVADLATGRVLHRVVLGGGPGDRAANDVTVAPDGTALVTDTLAGAVYRVDVRGRVRGVVRDRRFAGTGFTVNGIAWHPSGAVFTARYDTGEIFRIAPDGGVARVRHEGSLVGADGLAVRPDGSLLVVTNGLSGKGVPAVHVLRLVPGSHGTALREVATVPWPDAAPTTAAVTPWGTYVLTGRLDRLLTGDATLTAFTLRRVPA